MKPSYIMQINQFHGWLETHYLCPYAQLLWFKLINLHNKCGWSEWVQVDTVRLMGMIGVDNKNAAYRARDALVAEGLIDYKKGKKGSPSRYKLNYFLSQFDTENVTENEPKTQQKTKPINRQRQRVRQEEEIYKEVVELWNTICVDLPSVRDLSETRKQRILSASKKVEEFGGWEKLFKDVQSSDFLTGRDGKWRSCGFDWVLKPSNLTKVMEGNYRPKEEVPASYDIDEMEKKLIYGKIKYERKDA